MVASTLPEQQEFFNEPVNSESYQNRHMKMIFEEGFSFSGFERDRIWLRENGRYVDVSSVSGADDENDGRALLLADFDDDGDVDFFVHNTQRARHKLFRNDLGQRLKHGSVKVRLRATAGQWQAAGAVVRCQAAGYRTAQILALGSGFLSQNATELVFGTGADEIGEITVQWPGRAAESFGELAAGGSYLLVEGRGEAEAIARRPFAFPDPAAPGVRRRPGDFLSSVPLRDRDGAAVALDFGGGRERPVLLNFWATYCASCVAELPDLQALHDRGEYEVILVNLDAAADQDRSFRLLRDRGISLVQRFPGAELLTEYVSLEHLPLPTTLRIGADGRLEEIVQGPIKPAIGTR